MTATINCCKWQTDFANFFLHFFQPWSLLNVRWFLCQLRFFFLPLFHLLLESAIICVDLWCHSWSLELSFPINAHPHQRINSPFCYWCKDFNSFQYFIAPCLLSTSRWFVALRVQSSSPVKLRVIDVPARLHHYRSLKLTAFFNLITAPTITLALFFPLFRCLFLKP